MTRSYRLKLQKVSNKFIILFALVITPILWLHHPWTTVSPKLSLPTSSSSSSCQTVTIYGQTDQKRCYPLLVNFGHRCCRQSQIDNCETGLRFGVKHCVKLNMTVFDHDDGFRYRNKDILSRNRGAGYWIWKSYILWHELYVAREGDIILYSDAGVNFTAHIDTVLPFLTNQDVLMFRQTHHSESAYTKRDTFILMNADRNESVYSMASVASYVFVRKSIRSFAFISEWLTHVQDSRALTDDANVLGKGNYPDFIDHRHDQSILGLLSKKWNLTAYTDPSHWGENYSRPFGTLFFHHRYKH